MRERLGHVKNQLQFMIVAFESLEESVFNEWKDVHIIFLQNLYQSMPTRVEKCLKQELHDKILNCLKVMELLNYGRFLCSKKRNFEWAFRLLSTYSLVSSRDSVERIRPGALSLLSFQALY